MLRQQITIINKLGLHARAAAKLVNCAAAFSSAIQIGPPDAMVDGKSIMSVMMLAAGQGTVLELEVNGSDEAEALASIVALVENRFDEGE
ncbi:MAG: HPr family phosphocarrier protein [Pseudomonadota bacterium]